MANDEMTQTDTVRDYAKWVWLGIALMFAGMIAFMFLSNKESDVSRSMVRVRHILVKIDPGNLNSRQQALDLISDLRQQVLNGADMAQLAKDFSDDTISANRGGDLGFQPKDTFEEDFEVQSWNLPVGELSDIIETQFGFHILRVEERNLSKMDQYQMEIEKKADQMHQGE